MKKPCGGSKQCRSILIHKIKMYSILYMNIAQELKKAKPHLAPSSIKNYTIPIQKVCEALDGSNLLDCLDKIRNTKKVLEFLDSKKDTTKHVGFIAQEIKVIEESIGWSEDHLVNTEEEDSYKLQYSQITPLLVKAIQELSAKVEALENA